MCHYRTQGKSPLYAEECSHEYAIKVGVPGGGKINSGESAEDCLKRELVEELGVRVNVGNALPNHTHHYETFSVTLYPFICKIDSGEITLHEHSAMVWLPITDLHVLDWADATSVIEEYQRQIAEIAQTGDYKMMNLPPGLYDLLHTTELRKRIEKAGLLDRVIWGNLQNIEELPNKLAILLSREISSYISQIIAGKDEDTWQNALTQAIQSPQVLLSLIKELLPESGQILHQIKPPLQLSVATDRPDTPLSVSALLTGSSRSPALSSQLKKELANCDRADWLVSFIKYSGILPLMDTLRQFTQNPSSAGGLKLRIATTSYMGATDVKAIEELLKLPNTEIRISYDTKRTRLHAKAYLFHRATGFSSAYIGSANVSKAALDEGLEWTAKISQYESEHLWRHAVASFESHWEDNNEFTPCLTTDIPKLRQALAKEQTGVEEDDINTFFNLQPFGYQKAILEDIAAERAVGKHKHLVISATGTGKTMIASFDYKIYSSQVQSLPRFLLLLTVKKF